MFENLTIVNLYIHMCIHVTIQSYTYLKTLDIIYSKCSCKESWDTTDPLENMGILNKYHATELTWSSFNVVCPSGEFMGISMQITVVKLMPHGQRIRNVDKISHRIG